LRVRAPSSSLNSSTNIAEYPSPDVALEVDISPSRIDRPGIYAALSAAEIWRFDGDKGQIVIERLAEDRRYQQVEESAFLRVRADEVGRWVLDEDNRDRSLWARKSRDWVRSEVAPRMRW
jgi:hypothetical protein